jgi:hypothetical protein
MHYLSHKSIYNIYKSCSALHKETDKIGFTFFCFFFNFYGIYKITGQAHKRIESIFTQVPRKI